MIRSSSQAWLLALVLLLPSACEERAHDAPDEGPASHQIQTAALPIQGGYVSQDDKAVLGLVSLSDKGMGACSGSLIAPNLVLTAQHCVSGLTTGSYVQCGVSEFLGTVEPYQIYVTNQTQLPNHGNGYQGIKEILVPAGSGACGRDIALMILSTSTGAFDVAPLIPRVDTDHLEGDIYSAIGYGEVGDSLGGSGTRRRRDGLETYCVAEHCPYWMSTTEQEWVGEEGTCQGDSGGPALDEHGRVLGVVSRGGEGCTFPIYTHVAGWGDWIKESAVYAAQLGGYTPPAWATGWPTHPDYAYTVGERCEEASWCASGLCMGTYCTRKCSDLAPCPTGFVCDEENFWCELAPVGGSCEAGDDCASGVCTSSYCTRPCDDALPCPDDHLCDSGSGTCMPAILGEFCITNADCVVGFCHEGACTRDCDEADPCPMLYGCHPTHGFCDLPSVGAGCEIGSDCTTGLCEDGFCTRQCNQEAPCPPGYSCGEDWGCHLIPAGLGCDSSTECDGGFCEGGMCTRPCSTQAPCQTGLACDDSTGWCVEVPPVPSSGCGGSGQGTAWWLGALVLFALRSRREARATQFVG